MSKTTIKYSPEVREHAVQMVLVGRGRMIAVWSPPGGFHAVRSRLIKITAMIMGARQSAMNCRLPLQF